jgi:hypothetical protein
MAGFGAIAGGGGTVMGDFRNAVIFSREEIRVDFTEALGFKENTVTFRTRQSLPPPGEPVKVPS